MKLISLVGFLLFVYIMYIAIINSNYSPDYKKYNQKYKLYQHINKKYLPITLISHTNEPLSCQYIQKICGTPFILKSGTMHGSSTHTHLVQSECQYNELQKQYDIVILQQFIDTKTELAISIERGNIISVIQRKSKHPIFDETDDGRFVNIPVSNVPNTIKQLFATDLRLPLNHYRFDIKCASIKDFYNGKFFILEVNTDSGLDLRAFANNISKPVRFCYDVRFYMKRVQFGLENMLNCNIIHLFDGVPFFSQQLQKSIEANDYEKIFELLE